MRTPQHRRLYTRYDTTDNDMIYLDSALSFANPLLYCRLSLLLFLQLLLSLLQISLLGLNLLGEPFQIILTLRLHNMKPRNGSAFKCVCLSSCSKLQVGPPLHHARVFNKQPHIEETREQGAGHSGAMEYRTFGIFSWKNVKFTLCFPKKLFRVQNIFMHRKCLCCCCH